MSINLPCCVSQNYLAFKLSAQVSQSLCRKKVDLLRHSDKPIYQPNVPME